MQSLEVLRGMLGREATRAEVADALGVHVSTISRRITGQEGFRVEEVMQMCDFFRVSRCQMLIELGWLDREDVVRVAQVEKVPLSDTQDTVLLEELLSRARTRANEHATGREGNTRRRGKGFLN